MFPWSLLGSGIKAGLEIYKNKKAAEVAMSEAAIVHAEKMKKGEIEYQGRALDAQKSDWKDEFILLVLSSPLFLLAYSVFTEDESISKKLDLYFDKLQAMPWWLISLWVAVVGAVYGIKAADLKNFGGRK